MKTFAYAIALSIFIVPITLGAQVQIDSTMKTKTNQVKQLVTSPAQAIHLPKVKELDSIKYLQQSKDILSKGLPIKSPVNDLGAKATQATQALGKQANELSVAAKREMSKVEQLKNQAANPEQLKGALQEKGSELLKDNKLYKAAAKYKGLLGTKLTKEALLSFLKNYFQPAFHFHVGGLSAVDENIKKNDLYKGIGSEIALGFDIGKPFFGVRTRYAMSKFDINPQNLKSWVNTQSGGQVSNIFSNPFESMSFNVGPYASFKILKKIEIKGAVMPGISNQTVSNLGNAIGTQKDLMFNQDKGNFFNLKNTLQISLPISDKLSISLEGVASNTFRSQKTATNGEFQKSLSQVSNIDNALGINAGVTLQLGSPPKKKMEGEDEFHLKYHKLQREDAGIFDKVTSNFRFVMEDQFIQPEFLVIEIDGKAHKFEEAAEKVEANRYVLHLNKLGLKLKDKKVITFKYFSRTWYSRVEIVSGK